MAVDRLAPCPAGATLRDFVKASRHGCLLAHMQQRHCVSRTRRRICWLILSLAGWRWTAPSPSSPHLASRKKQGALGTADSGWETHCASFASLSCLLLSGHLVLSI